MLLSARPMQCSGICEENELQLSFRAHKVLSEKVNLNNGLHLEGVNRCFNNLKNLPTKITLTLS